MSHTSYTWRGFRQALSAASFYIVLALVIALFMQLGQVRDMVQQIGADGSGAIWSLIIYAFSLSFYSVTSWFCLRAVFDTVTWENHHNTLIPVWSYLAGKHNVTSDMVYYGGGFGHWFPRLVPVLPLIWLAIHTALSGFYNLFVTSIVVALAMVVFLYQRNRSIVQKLKGSSILLSRTFWAICLASIYLVTAIAAVFFQSTFNDVFVGVNLIMFGVSSVAFGLFWVMYFIFDLLKVFVFPRLMSFMTHAFNKPYPIVIPAIVITLVMGKLPSADNHGIRTIANGQHSAHYPFESLNAAFETFMDYPQGRFSYVTQVKGENITVVPVFFIASQGGGLRASYWSGVSLQYLEKVLPGFEHNIFALTGASGGTVGNVFYLASMLAEQATEESSSEPKACLDSNNQIPGSSLNDPQLCKMHDSIGKDYLSSVATSFVYNDLLYRFLPIPITAAYAQDRATYLEKNFEQGFEKTYGQNILTQPFRSVYCEYYQTCSKHVPSERTEKPWLPLLVGTSTVQELGLMSLYAPFPVLSNEFINKLDLQHYLNQGHFYRDEASAKAPLDKDIALSTLALNSARFPYVTPTGTIDVTKPRSEKRHLADAGYFDNYGATTTTDMIRVLFPEGNVKKGNTVYVPIAVVLKNDVWQDAYAANRNISPFDIFQPAVSADASSWFAHELTSPLQALVSIRGGLANTGLSNLIDQLEGTPYGLNEAIQSGSLEANALSSLLLPQFNMINVHYIKQPNDIDPPLGWWLSKNSMETMTSKIEQKIMPKK